MNSNVSGSGADEEDEVKKALQFSAINSDFWASTWKQKLLSMLRERESEWECVRVRECVSVRMCLFSVDMKTKVVQNVESEWMREWLLSIDMKTKVVQHVPRIILSVFKVFKFSGFQLLNFSSFQKHSWSPVFVWHSDIFSWEPALWTHESQERVMWWLLSKLVRATLICSVSSRLLSLLFVLNIQ